MITVTCKKCGSSFNTDDANAGKRAKCPNCGSPIEIPGAAPAAAPTPPPARTAPTPPTPAAAPQPEPAEPAPATPAGPAEPEPAAAMIPPPPPPQAAAAAPPPPPSPAAAPAPAQTAPRGHGGLAVAGMVLGIIALVLSFIPCINWLGLIPALVGLILSIVALATAGKAGRPKGVAVAGLICNILALIWIPLYLLLILGAFAAAATGAAGTSIPM